MANLLDSASILLTPTATNNGSILAIQPSDGSGDMSFSRNSAATRVNAQGLVENVASNLPRIDYTDGCGNWLLEPQSTNLITQSELFSDAAWSNNGTIVSNAAISPDGTQNAELFYAATSTGRRVFYNTTISSGSSYTVSVYAKANNKNFLYFTDIDNQLNSVWFDLSNGTHSTPAEGTANVKSVGNGWYRCSLITTSSTTTGWSYFGISDTSGSVSFTSNGTDGVYLWGAQLEQQSYATSYIPTQGAISTRLADIATNSGNASLINSEEGVLYAEISALANPTPQEVSLSVSEGQSGVNRLLIRIKTNGAIGIVLRVANTTEATIDSGVLDQSANHKVAVKWKVNDISLWIDGVEVGTDNLANVFPINTLDEVSFNQGNNSNFFYGKNKALAVYKTALTDANLRSLTYPSAVATTFDLNFNTIADDFTFTRGSEATFVNAQGLIQNTASNDAPRLDYSTGAEAFLLEPQSTNLYTYSNDVSFWSKSNVITTSDYAISPDGTQNAFRAVSSSISSLLYINSTGTIGTNNTLSVWAKSNGGSSNNFRFFANGATLVSNDYIATNQWQRFEFTYNCTSVTSGLTGASDSATNDILFYGFQHEAGSYATSYIPTSGASATRNQELCNNATPVINSEEGTLYAEISALADDQTNRIISLSDGTGNNQVLILYQLDSNILRVGFQVANQTDIVIDVNTNTTLISKIAVNYNSTSVKLYLNGSKVGETSTGYTFSSNVLDNLSFSYGSGILPFFGNTKDLKYYPKALADVQLQDLTRI